jgi:hypothetical protein
VDHSESSVCGIVVAEEDPSNVHGVENSIMSFDKPEVEKIWNEEVLFEILVVPKVPMWDEIFVIF